MNDYSFVVSLESLLNLLILLILLQETVQVIKELAMLVLCFYAPCSPPPNFLDCNFFLKRFRNILSGTSKQRLQLKI